MYIKYPGIRTSLWEKEKRKVPFAFVRFYHQTGENHEISFMVTHSFLGF